MRRFMLALCALLLIASACASDDERFRDALKDQGLTDEQADCTLERIQAAGIDPNSLYDDEIEDAGEIPPAAIDAVASCMLGIEGSLLDGVDLDDDATLDELYSGCEAGDGSACDQLYLQSPVGSDEEEFGRTCGGRVPEGDVLCAGNIDG